MFCTTKWNWDSQKATETHAHAHILCEPSGMFWTLFSAHVYMRTHKVSTVCQFHLCISQPYCVIISRALNWLPLAGCERECCVCKHFKHISTYCEAFISLHFTINCVGPMSIDSLVEIDSHSFFSSEHNSETCSHKIHTTHIKWNASFIYTQHNARTLTQSLALSITYYSLLRMICKTHWIEFIM